MNEYEFMRLNRELQDIFRAAQSLGLTKSTMLAALEDWAGSDLRRKVRHGHVILHNLRRDQWQKTA